MSYKYSDAFKLEAIKDYYNSRIGVPLITRKYNLPGKKYIKQVGERFNQERVISRRRNKAE